MVGFKVFGTHTSGATVTDPIQYLHWNGSVVCFPFEVRLPYAAGEATVRFKLRVFSNSVPAGTIFFNVFVKPAADVEPIRQIDQQAHACKRPYLSYAAQDRPQVLRAAQLIRALKMDFFPRHFDS